MFNASFLYAFVRPFAALGFEVYFKKMYVENIEAIPMDKPVFLAINHPTAFIEPCVVAGFVDHKPLNFLVRGDLWGKPFYNKLMAGVHLIPIFRKKDGVDKLQENKDTHKYCFDALAKNKIIMIMPEASTKEAKRLRPLSKGLARICLGSIDAYKDMDVHIVPVGANFTNAAEPRKELMLKVGTPIRVLDFYNKYPDNRNRAVLKLTQEVKKVMEECLVHVENEEDEVEQQIAHKINDLEEVEKAELKAKSDKYFSLLNLNKITDSHQYFNPKFYHWILLIIGFIPGWVGKIFHFPIIYLASFLSKKIKKKEFTQPVFWGVSNVGLLLYYIFWVIIGFVIKSKWLWIFLFAVPFYGYIRLLNSDLWVKLKNKMNYNKLSDQQKTELKNARQPILDFINPILEKYLN